MMADDLDAARAELARHAKAEILAELKRRGALPAVCDEDGDDLDAIRAELVRRGVLPPDEAGALEAELAEVKADLDRRAAAEADPMGAVLEAVDRLAEALAGLVQPRPVTKYIERDADGLISRIVEVFE